MNRWLTSTTAVVIALACLGCAGQHARTLAGDLLTVTQSYDAQRRAKAQAEVAYYQEQLRILRDVLGGSRIIADDQAVRLDDVKKTVAYGRIVTAARQEALVLAEALSSAGSPPAGAALLKYLSQGVKDDIDTYLESQVRQQQLRAELLTSLEKLDLQEARLETIAKHLKALQEPRTLEASVQELFAIGRAIQKQLAERGATP